LSPRTYGFQALGFEIASAALGRWFGLSAAQAAVGTKANIPQNWINMAKEGWFTMVYLYSLPKDIT
jgi:hypothetical protein